MQYAFYAHTTGFEKIKTIVQSLFPKTALVESREPDAAVVTWEVKGGFFNAGSSLRIHYRQKDKLSYRIEDDDISDLNNNFRGMYGFVQSLPTTNQPVKELLLGKIATLNCEFVVSQIKGQTNQFRKLIERLAEEMDAILFVQPNTPLSQSDTQHFLDKHLQLIIDQQGNCTIDTLPVHIESHYFDGPSRELTKDQVERKTRSEQALHARHIAVNVHLPCVEAEATTHLRTPEEIAQRVSVLAVTSLVAFDHMTSEEAFDYLKRYQLEKYITPGENAFLSNPTNELKNHETWKCEGIWTLLWALKMVDNLPFPDQLCDLGKVAPENYPLGKDKDPNTFIRTATEIRSKSDIIDANDLYYRLDWACVQARINGRSMTAVHPGIVYERHYALNWLVQYMDQEWDDVSCDT